MSSPHYDVMARAKGMGFDAALVAEIASGMGLDVPTVVANFARDYVDYMMNRATASMAFDS